MKRLVMMSSLVALMSAVGLADPAPAGSRNTTSDLGLSCQQMKTACMEAGFAVRAAKGKRLYKDCMQPLMDGKTVNDVAISSQVVEGCKANGRQGS